MKYSVLMAVYKNEQREYLQKSIMSMLSQTIKPDEFIIVKDGPLPSDLNELIEYFVIQNPGLFKIHSLDENIGLGLALNEGLKLCRNDLVARMDSDDISLPTRCQKQLFLFERNPELAIVGTHVDEFQDSQEDIISTRKVPINHDEIYTFAKRRSPFNHPSVMYRKSKVLACGGYASLRRNQDVDLFGRMLFEGCRAQNIDESLLLFRSNRALASRRRSWENTRSYIQTIYRFYRKGFSSGGDLFFVIMGQLLVFMAPVKLQNFIYKKFLR